MIAGLGIMMVMEYDSEPIVRPFRNLMSTIGSSPPVMFAKNGIEKVVQRYWSKDFTFSGNSDGTRVGLFWYGVAYGSAAAGCVAPVVIGLLTASIGKGIITGLLVFLIFSFTAGMLMVGFTMLVAASESTIVEKLKASTRQIEMAGGIIMIIVGLYLMWFYLSTSVF